MKQLWQIIQDELLGMAWLNRLVGNGLSAMGLDLSNRWVASAHFFVYDVIKITLLLCVLIFGVSYIQSFFPPERTRRILGRIKGVKANSMAALLGTVTPFCSCSSIPLFMGFTSAGLPLGVTFSFLISSPMVDLGSLVILTSIFGAQVALLYVGLGLLVAVLGGTMIQSMGMEKYVENFIFQGGPITGEVAEPTKKERIHYAQEQMLATLRKVFPYILIGVGIGAFIHNWIPEDLVAGPLGSGNILAVPLATLIGAPMYGDIFGTIPIAEALLGKGAQIGVVLAFMMGVTTLSLPSLIMLSKAIKPRLMMVFIGVCVVGIIAVGYFFNALSPFLV